MEETMSKKTAKKTGPDPILCVCIAGGYTRKETGSDPVFGFVQIEKAVFANYQGQHHTATVIKAIFRVRTTCELRELLKRIPEVL